MKVKKITNISSKRISILTNSDMEISLPPNQSYEDDLDIVNLKELGEKISYTADLTEVGNSKKTKKQLYD